MKSEYLIFNLIILCGSGIGVLVSRTGRFPHWRQASIAIALAAVPYILWDHAVTGSWWEFNRLYITGIRIGGLPIEEVLFFMTVPWSCLILWENMRTKISGNWNAHIEAVLIAVSAVIGVLSGRHQLWYTGAVAGILIIVSMLSLYMGRWLRRKSAAVFLGIVTVLTVVFDGYLTARPVVVYSARYMTNLRVGTVPAEDILYGLALMAAVCTLYEYLLYSHHDKTSDRR